MYHHHHRREAKLGFGENDGRKKGNLLFSILLVE